MNRQSDWRARAGTLFELEKQAVTGSRGVVAANNPIGSAAGAEMLALGGNALDAAIATLFTLNVVEPQMVGLFGAGWMHIRLADGSHIVIDNYASAPQAATPDMYTPLSDTWPDYMETQDNANKVGYLAMGTPGALKGWAEVIEKWGNLDWETVIQPAIRHAQRGYQASRYLCELIMEREEDLARFPASAAVFLPNGRPPAPGDLIVQPDLAQSLTTIAQEGPNVLYNGALGQMIVDDVQKNGGILIMDDLRAYQTVHRPPISIPYRGYEVTMPSPPCAGGVHLLQILRILSGFDVASLGFGTADAIHLLAECFKTAFADRAAHLGDPAEMDLPVDWLISEEYAVERRADIDMAHASTQHPGILPIAESASTTHVTTADADGNIACLTQTINETFGCKVTVPGTGILLNNTMALFDPHPGQANSVGPGRRTISSNAPAIVTKDGAPVMALGTPGGVRIFPSVVQAIVNVIDHGMTLQEAVEAPRIWTRGQELEVESAIPDEVRQVLMTRGHNIQEVLTVAGGMNGITFDENPGAITGAACWRADGSPIGLSGGPARPGIRFRPT